MTDENTCLTCQHWEGEPCGEFGRICQGICYDLDDCCDEWEALE